MNSLYRQNHLMKSPLTEPLCIKNLMNVKRIKQSKRDSVTTGNFLIKRRPKTFVVATIFQSQIEIQQQFIRKQKKRITPSR